jgi:hypothetical protein
MSAHPILHIASVNMRKRNAVTHALLNSNENAQLLLIQEPWFDKIGTARKDNARQGVDVLGGVASPAWELLYPGLAEAKPPKVMAYARKDLQHTANSPRFSIVPRLDICSHPTVQVLDIVLDDEIWQVINFYHDVLDITSRQALLALDISATMPTLIMGDFNTHSRSWSPPDTPRSSWATQIEEWAAANLLTLANNPSEITRRGAGNDRDAVLDLVWFNEAAIQDATFSNLVVDWAGSLGSDHAMIHISGQTREHTAAREANEDHLGFVVEPDKKDEWIRAFKARSSNPRYQLIPSPQEVEEASAALTEDINATNEEVFIQRHPFHPRSSPWWNASCDVAVRNLREAPDPATRKTAHGRLKGTVRSAKRSWADEYIEKTQLWEVAAWRHGRRLSKVPSLQGPNGLVHAHEDIADILSQRFFPQTPPGVEAHFPDDPPPRTTRSLPQIDKDLIEPLLGKTSGRSAPGQSGHTWTILKWAWAADADRLTSLFDACLRAGHHPRPWKEAVVCVIPKPKRADYTLAKNFRPISLLECLGKLLEKVIAKLIYSDMTKHTLVPTTQFGGCNASSTLDAGLALLHDIQAAHQLGLKTGILLFDIQGFFDNINHDRLVKTFENLGFAPELVSWCRSFLKDRTVKLRFNGTTSDPFDFTTGTPQGSPVSPVLSIIYTSPLLHKMRDWKKSSLGMYIDDGVVFACGHSWEEIEITMRNGYNICTEWLTRAGLNVEPDKTELLFFKKSRDRSVPPSYIHLPLPALRTYYRVQATTTLRYLGFFFDSKLNWQYHVEVACNRARATIKALQLLGNSVRGLDHAKWRLAYNGICLPVLTYGCQLWFTGKQVALVKKLQTVQNDAVKIISGSFRTAPREALHHLLTILPMDLRLNMLIQNTALRLYRVPKDSQLLKRLGRDWHPPSPDEQPLPVQTRRKLKTTLSALAARVPAQGPRVNPFPDVPVGAPNWNGRILTIPKQKDSDYSLIDHAATTACQEGFAVNVYCDGLLSNKDRADSKQLGAAAAVLYHEGREFGHSEQVFGETMTKSDTLIRSLSPALDLLTLFLATRPAHAHTPIIILSPSALAINRSLDASPHEEQAAALCHLEKLSELLTSYPAVNIRFQWLPRKSPFVGFRRAKQLAFEAIRVADLTAIEEPHTIRQQKDHTTSEAFSIWGGRYYQAPRGGLSYETALRGPPDGKPHPTFQPPPTPSPSAAPPAANTNNATPPGDQPKAKFSRRTYCTLYRIITGHVFVGEYTRRFYPQHTPDQIACPCGRPVQTVEHILLECPLYTAARRRHLSASGRTRTLPQLFENRTRVLATLRFLEETGACAKPRAEWEPG